MSHVVTFTKYEYDDGGRDAAGFVGVLNDCEVRAAAIATGKPYRQVHDEMEAVGHRIKRDFFDYMEKQGWTRHRMMSDSWLPESDRLLVADEFHVAAVIDGVLRDLAHTERIDRRAVEAGR